MGIEMIICVAIFLFGVVMDMTYLDLIRDADRKLDKGDITLGEYEEMIEPLNREIDHIADPDKKVSISCAHENDVRRP